jgi:hypothetical protein
MNLLVGADHGSARSGAYVDARLHHVGKKRAYPRWIGSSVSVLKIKI